MNYYDLGDVVRCTGTFTDADGNAQDPTAVFFQIKNPAGTITTYQYTQDVEVVRSSTGVYYVDVDGDAVGTWDYRCYSTGTGQAAAEKDFQISKSEFD